MFVTFAVFVNVSECSWMFVDVRDIANSPVYTNRQRSLLMPTMISVPDTRGEGVPSHEHCELARPLVEAEESKDTDDD